jgi:hypothetical protein
MLDLNIHHFAISKVSIYFYLDWFGEEKVLVRITKLEGEILISVVGVIVVRVLIL